VVSNLQEEKEFLSKNINREFDRQLIFGQRVADRVAEFGGSWRVILLFAVLLVVWIRRTEWPQWRDEQTLSGRSGGSGYAKSVHTTAPRYCR
jgi:hypothetical protein